MRRLLSILFWSILSAAFIGPGTVTVASSAGHAHGLALLWALTFSTIACIVLQEASARVAVLSGQDLGRALRTRFRGTRLGLPVRVLVAFAIVTGCAAYQAGNILGGVAGLRLVCDVPPWILTLVVGAVAALLLALGTIELVARALGIVVALMGIVFFITAAGVVERGSALIEGAFVPVFPAGAGWLVLGLVGTTVVPYNLFLGSGLASGRTLSDVRFGIIVAVALGGLVSMAVLVVGTSVTGEFTLAGVADALADRLGAYAGPFFAFGLFAAGLSSAITAPLAAAITADALFGPEVGTASRRSPLFRATWIFVLACGLGFGIAGVKPVPAIVMAQALNGVLLPLVAVFLIWLVNDRRLVGADGRNGPFANALLVIVVVVTFVLGGANVVKALF